MPAIRVVIDTDNHNALKKMAIDSGLTLKKLVQITLIDLVNKRSARTIAR